MNLKTTHSIVIGPNQVNYCNLSKKTKKSIINSLAYYDFSFDRIEDLEDIMDSLSDMVGKNALFNLSIINPGIIKHIYFYKKGVSNIKTNILRDLKNDYEIQLQDYLIDFEKEEFEDKTVVFVAAVPKQLFEKIYVYIEKRKNIKLFSLEIGLVSIKRLINHFYSDNDIKLCIRMDSNFSSIFAIRNNIVVVSRELQYGFENFIKDVVEYGGVDKQKALNIMENIGLHKDESYTEEELKAYDIISSSFDKMSIEIQRTIDYLLSNQKMSGINKIITLGLLNKVKKSDIYLSKLFSIGVDKFEPTKLIEFDSSIDFSLIKDMLYFDVAAGAAIRRLS